MTSSHSGHTPRAIAGLVLLGMILAGCASWHGPRVRPLIAARAANIALAMRGVPYRYGGDTRHGFDCSGLVYYSFRREGVLLPRTAYGQSRVGRTVARDDLRKGDLLFFDEDGRAYGHVGIYLGRGLFVHAPASGQRVGIASLRNPYWRARFAFARRLW